MTLCLLPSPVCRLAASVQVGRIVEGKCKQVQASASASASQVAGAFSPSSVSAATFLLFHFVLSSVLQAPKSNFAVSTSGVFSPTTT